MDLYTLKAQYLSGEDVYVRLELEPEEKTDRQVLVRVWFLETLVLEKTVIITENSTDIKIGKFRENFCGYGVTVSLNEKADGKLLETAFDVVENPRQSLRYGFVSDFRTEDKENGAIEELRKYHINMVQYYDWSHRHDQLVSEERIYTDMMGKPIDSETVKEKIEKARSYGMESIAYGAVYAASKDFYEKHKEWAFYNSNQEVFKFIEVFYIMNIAKKSPWRKHLIEQYRQAIERMGFSGIHMDTYGFPKKAYSHLNHTVEQVKLQNEFGSLIDETRETLKDKNPLLIFNNVGNWPVNKTAPSGVDAVYIEVWKPYERYFHIKQLIREAKIFSEYKKPVILAAYLEPFRLEDMASASYAAYILTAAIITNGAYHLLLGEKNSVLTQGYYGDYTKMAPETACVMRHYYDFMIRYMNLFYDETLEDVSMTHIGWDNYEYQCMFDNWSPYGEAGKVWLTIRENEKLKTLSLINLCGCTEDYWNKGKNAPTVQKNLTFCIHVEKEIKGVWCASPDEDSCGSSPIAYEYFFNEKGRFIKFSVPKLSVWSLIYIRL